MATYLFRFDDDAGSPAGDDGTVCASDADALREAARTVAELLKEQTANRAPLSNIGVRVVADDGRPVGEVGVRIVMANDPETNTGA